MSGARRPTFVLGLLLLLSCASPEESAPPMSGGRRTPAEAASAVPARRVVIGRSVEGRPIRLGCLGDGPLTVLFLASIHGTESAGTALLERLESHLAANPGLLAGRRILLVPEANPDGVANRTRGNARGVDLNRNFPADNFRGGGRRGGAPLSEPESRALAAVIREHRPDRVITLHEPLAVVDWDGPDRDGRADDLAQAMARACGLPVRRLGAKPGSLGSWVGITLGRPIVTLELPGSARRLDPEERWRRYGAALVAAISRP